MSLLLRSRLRNARLRIAIGLVIGLTIVTGGPAGLWAGSSSPPATAPTQTPAELRVTLLLLSNGDPDVRESARQHLMGLSAADLPTLRSAIEQCRPLPPGDGDALHEIVTHVFLTGENTDSNIERGFMGVMMRSFETVYSDGQDDDSDLPLGVVVNLRLPGFAAYRALRDGDVILAISADGMESQRVRNSERITQIIGQFGAGTRVRLQVLREGRRIETEITLDARPRELDPDANSFEHYRRTQDEKAQAFWSARFAPIVDESIS